MTQINTKYENLGPVVREIRQLKVGEFFQLPDGGGVYRLLDKGTVDAICIDLDDLTPCTLLLGAVVEPREVNKIDINVELL